MSESKVLDSLENSGELQEHLDRLVNAERFRKTPSLRHLLRYLVDKAVAGETDSIKETVIAMEVFGRSAEFDGRLDNIVRVQASRLRKLLENYYADEGAGDTIRLTLPKGGYAPAIVRCDSDALPKSHLAATQARANANVDLRPPPKVSKRTLWPVVPAFALGGVLAITITMSTGWLMLTPKSIPAASESFQREPLQTLWKHLLQPGMTTVVAYTNPVFLWADTPKSRVYFTYNGPLTAPLGSELRLSKDDPYLDPATAALPGPFFLSDSWTGVGEVTAMHKLTELSTQAGLSMKVIRGRALTYGDMKGSNVIFLGSPWANDMQEKFNIGATPLVCQGNVKIVNRERKDAEPAEFNSVFEPGTRQLLASYGLFSVVPGVTAGTKIVSAAGINTYATSATLEFMTSAAGVKELTRSFGNNGLPDYFQAVVRTEIIKGDAANSRLVMVKTVKVPRLY